LRIGTEVIVTLPPERVMSALAPIAAEGAPSIQPHAEMSSASSSPEDSSSRAKRALFGAGI
jgi:two-component system cell cycle sensor histidine kinase PleC